MKDIFTQCMFVMKAPQRAPRAVRAIMFEHYITCLIYVRRRFIAESKES